MSYNERINKKPIEKKAFRKVLDKHLVQDVEASVLRLAKRGFLKRAARLAIEKQLKNGVPAVWMEKGVVYKKHPNGKKEIIVQQPITSQRIGRKKLFIQPK